MKLEYLVEKNNDNNTVNNILNNVFNLSSRLKAKLIKSNNIYLNGNICDTRNTIKPGDIVSIILDYEEDNSNILPTKMYLDIIFEDEWLLIINKPAGIAIHPSILHYDNSLCNGVKYYFDSIGLKKKIRPVNRLDKNTSGLVVFTKCEYIQECLINQMKNKSFKKEYLAIASGVFENKNGTINLPIARKNGSIIERCINENGQQAITHYQILKEYDDYSLVKCTLETGRTHQIRVHMSATRTSTFAEMIYMVEILL